MYNKMNKLSKVLQSLQKVVQQANLPALLKNQLDLLALLNHPVLSHQARRNPREALRNHPVVRNSHQEVLNNHHIARKSHQKVLQNHQEVLQNHQILLRSRLDLHSPQVDNRLDRLLAVHLVVNQASRSLQVIAKVESHLAHHSNHQVSLSRLAHQLLLKANHRLQEVSQALALLSLKTLLQVHLSQLDHLVDSLNHQVVLPVAPQVVLPLDHLNLLEVLKAQASHLIARVHRPLASLNLLDLPHSLQAEVRVASHLDNHNLKLLKVESLLEDPLQEALLLKVSQVEVLLLVVALPVNQSLLINHQVLPSLLLVHQELLRRLHLASLNLNLNLRFRRSETLMVHAYHTLVMFRYSRNVLTIILAKTKKLMK